VGEEEVTRPGVLELPPVVTLNTPNGATELSGNPSEEVTERGKRVKLQTQVKSP
jgi:hypothetical protein